MSVSICLQIDTSGPDPVDITESRNYTHNVQPMWRLAAGLVAQQHRSTGDLVFGFDGGETVSCWPPCSWHGQTASDVIPQCAAMVAAMEAEPDAYRALNPDNGWGDYEGALDFLRHFLADCVAHPKATVWTWC